MNVMKYQEEYKRKLRTLEDLLFEDIHEGDTIHSGYDANTPMGFFEKIHLLKDKIAHLNIVLGADDKDYPYMQEEELQDRWQVYTDFLGPNTRNLHNRFPEMLEYLPGDISRVKEKYLTNGLPCDVAVISVTPMDENGYFHHSLSCEREAILLERAKTVIVEVNSRMPVVYGDTAVHISKVDFIYEYDHKLLSIPNLVPSGTDTIIGQYVAELVQDRDTIQIGLGSIPNAVCKCLKDKRDLGIHTEMYGDGIRELYEAGAVTNAYSAVQPGKMLATFILGTEELYQFVDRNPNMYVGDIRNVVRAEVMSRNNSMVSINTAVEVDLTGQICSETIGHVQYSGTGGATETAEGATYSPHGRSIICLKSTAKKGTRSTIRVGFDPGAVVTISRNTVDYVITEYGIAKMRGKSLRQRAEALISIAHPDFRQELRKEAQAYGLF